MKGNKGFTLIELMVVIIILGILAAIAAPRYMAARDRANATEAVQQIGVIAQDVQAFRQTSSSEANPASLAAIGYDDGTPDDGWDPGGNSRFIYTYTDAVNGAITATEDALPSRTITLTNVNGVAAGVWSGTHPGRPS